MLKTNKELYASGRKEGMEWDASVKEIESEIKHAQDLHEKTPYAATRDYLTGVINGLYKNLSAALKEVEEGEKVEEWEGIKKFEEKHIISDIAKQAKMHLTEVRNATHPLAFHMTWQSSYHDGSQGYSEEEYAVFVKAEGRLVRLPDVVGFKRSTNYACIATSNDQAEGSIGKAIKKRGLKPLAIYVAHLIAQDWIGSESFSECTLTRYPGVEKEGGKIC